MSDDIIFSNPSGFISTWYWIISIALLIIFSSYFWMSSLWSGYKKVILLFSVLICSGVQLFTARFGFDAVYHYFGFTAFDDIPIRYAAMFFFIAYLFFLPVFFIKKGKKK